MPKTANPRAAYWKPMVKNVRTSTRYTEGKYVKRLRAPRQSAVGAKSNCSVYPGGGGAGGTAPGPGSGPPGGGAASAGSGRYCTSPGGMLVPGGGAVPGRGSPSC